MDLSVECLILDMVRVVEVHHRIPIKKFKNLKFLCCLRLNFEVLPQLQVHNVLLLDKLRNFRKTSAMAAELATQAQNRNPCLISIAILRSLSYFVIN